MGGISSSVGLISGLNTDQIISQLLQVEARPRVLAQRRVLSLQGQQAAYLDINGKLSALKTAAGRFRTEKTFDAAKATSSNSDVLTATANAGAPAGSYSFLVSRTVSTQQVLSRGFTDRDTTSLGLTKLVFEPQTARLDRETSLSELNGGTGAERGKIEIVDSSGAREVIDLSRVATVSEVIDAINNSTGVRVKVEAKGTKLVVKDNAGGGGTLRIADISGTTTASDLGIAGTAVSGTITGTSIYTLGNQTSLQSLRDGLGVAFNTAAGSGSTADFEIKTRDGSTYDVDVGDIYQTISGELKKVKAAVATVEQLAARIAEQTDNKVQLTVNTDGQSFKLTDTSTPTGNDDFQVNAGTRGSAAQDLGLVSTTSTDTINGRTVLSSINSTLANNLAGGNGLTATDFSITSRAGVNYAFNVPTTASVSDIIDTINTQTSGNVTAALSDSGTSVVLTDKTNGSNPLIVTGGGATQLGVATSVGGVSSTTVAGTRLQRRYVTEATTLASLNAGSGIGTGTFDIVGPTGSKATIDIGSDSKTIGDVISEINSKNIGVKAQINTRGDGIVIGVDPSVTSPSTKIKITDVTGTVAKNLNLVGEAADTTTNNFVDGSFERSITLLGSESLDELVTKINAANVRVRASVVRDNNGATPFRLRLTSTLTGEAGRFALTSEGGDLGLSTITRGDNARIFFGSDDPAKAILASSTTNSFASLVDGVTINVNAASSEQVSLNVTRDTTKIKEAVTGFVTAFNEAITRIDRQTAYDAETQQSGPLLGDNTVNQLRSSLYNGLLRKPQGVSGNYQFLSQVGLRTGRDGKLELDEAKLDAAIEADPENVKNLFAASSQEPRNTRVEILPGIFATDTQAQGAYTQRGVAELFVATIDSFIDRQDGYLTRANNALTDQIELQNDRIADMTRKLETRQALLQNQFATLETTLARLQSQQSALSGLASLRR